MAAAARSRCKRQSLATKSFQRLGYFPTLAEIPLAIGEHLRACLALVGPIQLGYAQPKMRYRHWSPNSWTPLSVVGIFSCVASGRADVSDDARKSVHGCTIFESKHVSNPVHTLMLDEVNPLRAAPLRNSAQSPTKSASYRPYIVDVNFLVDATHQ